MSSEDTLIGNEFELLLGDGESPEGFSSICFVTDAGQIGEEKPLIDVTALCDNARTYRNGLADGVEIPLVGNFIQGDTGARALYAKYKANELASFRLRLKATPDEYFEYRATVRAWNLAVPNGDKAAITFTLKISGEITWVQAP